MNGRVLKILFLLLAAAFLVSSGAGAEVGGGQATVTLDLSPVTPTSTPTVTPTPSSSTLFVSADDAVKERGYTVNGVANATSVPISTAGQDIVIIPTALPQGMLMNFTFSYLGFSASMVHSSFNERFPRHNEPITLSVHLSLEPITPVDPTPTPTVTPTHGPDTPSDPDRPTPVPTATPTVTPGPTVSPTQSPTEPSDSDDDDPFFPIPGSDEPLFPILPPAGSVHSIAGLIPLAAGILLLFLVFFWKRKVYRILKHHAKQHGEKPDKDQLKATADAVIRVIRSDEYAGWRTDSVLTARLSAEIIRILDEMQYPSAVPREPVVAEILKSAKSKINRHRL